MRAMQSAAFLFPPETKSIKARVALGDTLLPFYHPIHKNAFLQKLCRPYASSASLCASDGQSYLTMI